MKFRACGHGSEANIKAIGRKKCRDPGLNPGPSDVKSELALLARLS